MRNQRSPQAAVYRAWYGTARWQKLRARQLQQEPLCRMCLNERRVTAATVCDHIDPHNGDPELFWRGPFQSLCKDHHDSDKQRIEKGGRPRSRVGADGWPIE